MTPVVPLLMFFDADFYALFEEEKIDSIGIAINDSGQQGKLDVQKHKAAVDNSPLTGKSIKKKRSRLGSVGTTYDSLYHIKTDNLDLGVTYCIIRIPFMTNEEVSVQFTTRNTMELT